jgi:hypothetical protein
MLKAITPEGISPITACEGLPKFYATDGTELKDRRFTVIIESVNLEWIYWPVEYDPETREIYGYVTNCPCPEWGYTSLDELKKAFSFANIIEPATFEEITNTDELE